MWTLEQVRTIQDHTRLGVGRQCRQLSRKFHESNMSPTPDPQVAGSSVVCTSQRCPVHRHYISASYGQKFREGGEKYKFLASLTLADFGLYLIKHSYS
jgi:hypothetical protein